MYVVKLAELETNLLNNLTDANPDTILENIELIDSLEVTKKTSIEIQQKQEEAKTTEIDINKSRETYRPVAAEGAMLYFLLIQLCVIDFMYQYSLESFTTFFFKAIEKTEDMEEEEKRVAALVKVIRMTIYQWVSRGLFEQHKQIFLAQLTFRLMSKGIIKIEYTNQELSFLINCPTTTAVPNPLKKWLPDASWYAVQKLIEIERFESFA